LALSASDLACPTIVTSQFGPGIPASTASFVLDVPCPLTASPAGSVYFIVSWSLTGCTFCLEWEESVVRVGWSGLEWEGRGVMS